MSKNNNNINELQDDNFNLFNDSNNIDKGEKKVPNVKMNKLKNIHLSNLDNNEKQVKEENEEILKKKQEEEKQKNEIRNKLKCFICFGKAANAMMCPYCKKIACEQCLNKVLDKVNVCPNCKSILPKKEIVKLRMIDNFRNFFINNMEQPDENDNEVEDEEMKELKEQKCKEHPYKNLEYFCMNCNEYLCSESLLIFNKESWNKHNNHIILNFDDIEKYKLLKIIKEYQSLSENQKKLGPKEIELKKNIKELNEKKYSINYICDKLKDDIKSKYEKSISNIKSALKSLKYKKKDINEMIQKPPNLMVDLNNEEKSKKILDELRGLNSLPIGEKDLDVEVNFQKEIKLEQYESQPFEIKLPNNGEYIEGHNLLKTELDFIPNAKCTLNCQLLLSCYNLSLSLEIDYKFSIEHQEKYIGYLYLRNNKTTKSIFLQGYSTIKEVILYTEYDYNKIKEMVNKENKCFGKFIITKYYNK